jgi:tRNA(Ile)-lysidine synthase TilS/MesJ
MPPSLPIDTSLLKPGCGWRWRVSGGADSVALLRALAERSGELGLVLHAAHLHHGLRGAEADGDLEFCRALAAELGCLSRGARGHRRKQGQCGNPAKPPRPLRKRRGGCATDGSGN